ncbi:GNAT family N-acetyltransferase [bacterium]|nr:GNAT family N-acetyltransferase [candidate division CSSED10-310 bacterium]
MSQTPEIRFFQTDDIPAVNALFHDVFAVDRTSDHWEWKYFRNPHGDSVAAVAVSDGSAVGFYGLIPRRIRIGNTIETAYQEVDLMVHPEHGGGGAFKKMGQMVYDRVEAVRQPCTFGFPNQTSLPLGRRILGWRAIRSIPLYTMLLAPARVLHDKMPHFPGGDRLLNGIFGVYHRIRGRHRFRGMIRDVTDRPFPAGDAHERDGTEIAFIRDAAYLTWRYRKHPDRAARAYRIYEATTESSGVGWCIVSMPPGDRATICELMYPRPWRKDAIAAMIRHIAGDCRRAGCHSLRVWALDNTPEAGILASIGFFARDARNYHVIRSFRQPEFNRRLFDADRWIISAGDSDCV